MPQINARDWIFQVSKNPDAGSPTWAQIAGLESFDLNPAESEESTDTTVFESGGHAESQAMQRGASCKVEGKIVRTDGVPDAGQAAADDLSTEVGEASLGGFRFRHIEDDEWTVWTAWVSKGSNSGGKNDKTTWSASFMRSGAATVDAVA